MVIEYSSGEESGRITFAEDMADQPEYRGQGCETVSGYDGRSLTNPDS